MTLEVLGEYVAQAGRVEKIEENAEPGNWYQLIYAHNHLVVSSYAQRPGLMRCLFQLADEEEEFARMLRESFLEQMNWLVKLMPGLFPDTTFARHQALMIAYSLAGAGETLLKEYFVNANPALTAAKLSTDDITELLSTMFYRALFLEHPADKELSYTRNLSTMTKKQMSTKA